LTLFGEKVRLNTDLGFMNNVAKDYLACFSQIETRADLREHISPSTKFIAQGTTRVTFSIRKDGKKINYVATPDDVLRVVQSSPTEQLLVDDSTGLEVHEEMNRKDPYNFYRTYTDPEGRTVRTTDYELGFKRTDWYYNPETGNKIREVSYLNSIGPIHSEEIIFNENGEKLEVRNYSENGELHSIRTPEYTDIFNGSEQAVIRAYERKDAAGNTYFEKVMLNDTGGDFGNIELERQRNPEMTDDEYLDMLARNLDSPEKFQVFFENLVTYLHDDPAKRDATYQTPNIGEGADYWQLPTETINRIERGKMLGDCDDYAFLAQEILARQDVSAYVIFTPGHAVCVYVKQRPDGRYDAHSIGTYGVDINGNRLGMDPDPEKEKGYETLQDALNSLMVKYRNPDTGLDSGVEFEIEDTVKVLSIPSQGAQFRTDMPLEVFTEPLLWEAENTRGDEAIEVYLRLSEKYPDNPLYKEKLANKYAAQSKYEQAKNVCRELIKEYPNEPDYKLRLLRVYQYADEFEEAVDLCQQFIEDDPENNQLYRLELVSIYRSISLVKSSAAIENSESIGILEELIAEGMDDSRVYSIISSIYKKDSENAPEKVDILLEHILENFDNLSAETLMSIASNFHYTFDRPGDAASIYKNLFDRKPHEELPIDCFTKYSDLTKAPRDKLRIIKAGLAAHPNNSTLTIYLDKISAEQ